MSVIKIEVTGELPIARFGHTMIAGKKLLDDNVD